MNFQDLYQTDVSKHIEKKGKFNYLSWVYAVKVFRQSFPNGTWEIKHFGDNHQPYCQTDAGAFVEVTVFPEPDNAVGFTQVHPVLDHRNKTILKPNAFDINTSIQRCLAKAIALTGLGLHIYAGEDLPEEEKKPEPDKEKPIKEWNKRRNWWMDQAKKNISYVSLKGWYKDNLSNIQEDLGKKGVDEITAYCARIKQEMDEMNAKGEEE